MSTMYEDVDMENPDGVSGDGSDVCDGLIGVVVNCLLSSSDVNRGKEFVSKTMKAATGIATATTTAITLYNNYDKIKKIVSGLSKK